MSRIKHFLNDIILLPVSLENYASVYNAVKSCVPDECYHLAAQSFVANSFEDEFTTMSVNVGGTHNVLSAIQDLVPACKFYFAGSSEMFGSVKETPQNENTPFNPVSPYGISKVAGFHLTKYYRERHGLFACNGILFNHESPRRGTEFVTRKITRAVARIKQGLQKELVLGNLDAKRDWGYAPDYVEAMWLMLQQDEPDDYVVATGETHTVREFVELAFKQVDLDWKWNVRTDEKLCRPAEVNLLLGNSFRARKMLGWEPEVGFKELVRGMVESDLALCRG
uniref:GDP-mannose 4,6-dehydratase n=1 Tax=viral metagenome TaxID=1070528 RepID=A0A6M3ME10_9ZZZZ